jgi:two-component system, chemotaxis family, sensor kinase CheA
MSALGEQFVSEARELIAQATDALIAIEQRGAGDADVARLLRAFHTLKGSAGLLDLPAMTLTMHAAEDLVTAVHGKRIAATAAVFNQALACLDLVARWVDAFESDGELPPDAGREAREASERLRAPLSSAAVPAAPSGDQLPEWARQLIARHQHIGAQAASADLHALSYQPHAACFFDGDDPLQLVRRVPGLLALHVEGPDGPLADLDPFACGLRFEAIAAAPRDQLAALFRQVPDQVRIVALPAGALSAAPRDDAAASRRIVDRVIGEQCAVLRAAGEPDGLAGRIGAAARTASNALRHAGRDQLASQIAEAGSVAQQGLTAEPLIAALERALTGGEDAPAPAAVVAAAYDNAASRWVRVPEARVDALINLAGELIVLKNSFALLARRVEADAGADLARAVRREQEAIERLSAGLHDAALGLRMVPVAQVLRPFPRLVRDLSQRLGKKIELVMRGEATESDKAIVDRLHEPLLHIVRNALDHGVETPEARAAAGKPETGTITIAASQGGDRIVIEISDDGRGIDRSAVLRKAEERTLMPREALLALSDEQVLDLIFASGMSTAAAITDISGRGVGMDVVRQTVEQVGGNVSLSSSPGTGTTVRLDLPVSIATAQIMVVEAAGQRFGIAMGSIAETVRVKSDRIRTIKSNEGFVLRDRVVPICSLASLMGLAAKGSSDGDARLLIIVEAGAKIAAVEVDAIQDRMQAVLKPMQGLLAATRGYAGTTIQADGSVLLVLDVRDILP